MSNNSIYVVLSISIHTFLVEGDDVQYQITELTKISIHTFLTEGDHMRGDMARIMPFQSTPSLRKVTPFFHRDLTSIYISIHTFLAEGDNKLAVARYTLAVFQSTPSLQKVTWIEDSYTVSVTISIHTFLAEGDGSRMSVWRAIPNFNPHLPCGR